MCSITHNTTLATFSSLVMFMASYTLRLDAFHFTFAPPKHMYIYPGGTTHIRSFFHHIYFLALAWRRLSEERARNSHMLTMLLPLRENCRRSFFFDLIIWRALAFELSRRTYYSHLHGRFWAGEREVCVRRLGSVFSHLRLLNWFLHHQKGEEHLYCGVHTQYIGALGLSLGTLANVECENASKSERCCGAGEHSHKLYAPYGNSWSGKSSNIFSVLKYWDVICNFF